MSRFEVTCAQVRAVARDHAAPAGGALKRGRGCLFPALSLMLGLPAAATPLAEMTTSSGLTVQFMETVQDHSSYGLTVHFRFVLEGLGEPGRAFDDVAPDMERLCTDFAVPRLANTGPQPRQIVITLSGQETAFGETAPDTVQFFEAYSVQDGTCIWEAF